MLTERQLQLYAEREELPKGPQRREFIESHDELSVKGLSEYMTYQRRHATILKPARRQWKRTILQKQDNRCALCERKTTGSSACLDSITGKVVCRRCLMGMAGWRKLRADGITEEDQKAFNVPRRP